MRYTRPKQRSLNRVIAVGCVGALVCACGGGGGGDRSNPQPSAQPPTQPPTPPVTSGCSVTVAEGPFDLVFPRDTWETRSPESQGLCPDELEDASNYAFAAGNATGAVLIIKNGFIVFERYAEDRGVDDMVTSWSVGKSFTSMLMGIALEDERIANLNQSVSAFVQDWSTDSRQDISVDHIMTLRTALTEPDAGAFYGATNQLGMAIDRELVGEPGEKHVTYSNADVMVAGEVIAQATGMNAQEYFDLNVGESIGFSGDWWVDEVGKVMTYCCIDSTPREFARFGLLYVRDGLWIEEQVVPREWVASSTQPAREESTYLYYWWPVARGGFGAFGIQGQMVVIYPEIDLVVLRFTRYIRRGDGRPIKTRTNYHDTPAPEDFDNGTFLSLVRDSVPD